MSNTRYHNRPLSLDTNLAYHLVSSQFPQWENLPIQPVIPDGWDHKTFRLGKNMLIRMPSAAEYAAQVAKEQRWLPKLAPHLPLLIPAPIAIGKPNNNYPWQWSIYHWLEGKTAASVNINSLSEFAAKLAQFLTALQRIDPTNGPPPGPHNFYRGGSLKIYDAETRKAINILKNQIDADTAIALWERALATNWEKPPVWVHGDISAGNLLVQDSQLSAVIDFGMLATGDPACDLAIAWTLFQDESRKIFRKSLSLDADTWIRGQAWALWKALIIAARLTESNNIEAKQCWHIIDEILMDHNLKA